MENNTPVDLDKARDEKCFPLVRDIFADVSEDMIPQDANVEVNYAPLVIKIMQKTLAADTNIATENSYIFQLILGILSGLNRTVQGCTTLPIDDVRYGTIARKILKIVSDANVRLASTEEESKEDFVPIKEQLNTLFAEEKLSMMEIKYIMDNIFDSFQGVTNMFNGSVEQSSKKAEAKLFKIEDINDLTMGKLDEVLKAE